MIRIAMRSEYGDLVTTILQANCCVYDESFCAANAQIWVEEDDVLSGDWHLRCHLFIS